jgi:hypothetical protein
LSISRDTTKRRWCLESQSETQGDKREQNATITISTLLPSRKPFPSSPSTFSTNTFLPQTLLLPFSISLFLYLSATYLILPFYRSQQQNLPIDTVSQLARRAKDGVKQGVWKLACRFRKPEDWDEDAGEEDEEQGMLNYEEDRGRLWRGTLVEEGEGHGDGPR